MDRLNIEERAAKCNICSRELTITENLLHGNRCVFCCQEPQDIGLFLFIALCYCDWLIYKGIVTLIKKKGRQGAHMLFLGCISEAGGMDIADIRTVKQKRSLLKILRREVKK